VSIGQRKSGGRVIEHAGCPGGDRMAGRALRGRRRETCRYVIRNIAANRRRALERGGVASIAIRRVQRVVVAHVAGRAGRRRRRHVRAGQREARRAVIEYCCCPAGCVVARRAIGRGERRSGSRVHRIVRPLPCRQMALRISAIGGSNRQIVIVINMAGCAGHVGVSRGEQETRGAVIECRRGPADCRMAGRAIRHCECGSCGRMRGIRCRLPSRQMAARVSAIGRGDRQIVIVIDMAKRAGDVGVAVGQQKSGGAVIEFRIQPVVKRMAVCAARCGKLRSCGLVLRVRSSQPIGHVAARARGRKPDIISHSGIRVALLALHHSVGAEQRKPVEVILNRLRGNLPAERRVALRAIRAHLRAMNIRVAIGAIFSHVGEHRFCVATRAGDFCVHSA